jgi:hypothetical protein
MNNYSESEFLQWWNSCDFGGYLDDMTIQKVKNIAYISWIESSKKYNETVAELEKKVIHLKSNRDPGFLKSIPKPKLDEGAG